MWWNASSMLEHVLVIWVCYMCLLPVSEMHWFWRKHIFTASLVLRWRWNLLSCLCGQIFWRLNRHQWRHWAWLCSSNRKWRIFMKLEKSLEGEKYEIFLLDYANLNHHQWSIRFTVKSIDHNCMHLALSSSRVYLMEQMFAEAGEGNILQWGLPS